MKVTWWKDLGQVACLVVMFFLLLPISSGFAIEIDTGNSDLSLRFTNTLKYSVAARLGKLDTETSGTEYNPNIDAGDHNFARGLISNRVDLLSELDLVYKRMYGARVSGAAWYDTVYHDDTDSDLTVPNALSVGNDKFTDATEKLHGEKAEFLDYFVFGNFKPFNKRLSAKVGAFTQLYGESLFFGANGVANAQAVPDIIKLLSVPNSQFKEFMRPVEQVAVSLLATPKVTIGAYYQLEWKRARLPGAGSYFSFADFVDAGGEVLFAPFGPLNRTQDIEARDSGQGGMQVKFREGDMEFGLYATRHHDKFPQFYVRADGAGVKSNTYSLVYAEDIETYGASVSTVVGDTNIAAELSYRHNTPLNGVGNVMFDADGTGDNNNNPLYPVGNTWHLNMSAISVFAANPLWDGADIVAEVAMNYLDEVSQNPDQLDPNATRTASAVRAVFTPAYFQVFSGVDAKLPIGVGYGISGRSSVSSGMPPEHGGDVSLGLQLDFNKVWQASANVTHFFGKNIGVVEPPDMRLSYGQMHHDRDFVSIAVQRTF